MDVLINLAIQIALLLLQALEPVLPMLLQPLQALLPVLLQILQVLGLF